MTTTWNPTTGETCILRTWSTPGAPAVDRSVTIARITATRIVMTDGTRCNRDELRAFSGGLLFPMGA